MLTGSLVFSPILNAGVGVVGDKITSTFLNACQNHRELNVVFFVLLNNKHRNNLQIIHKCQS